MLLIFDSHLTLFRKISKLIIPVRGGSRTAATSKMEHFVTIVNCFQLLTIITKSSILDCAAVLDPPLTGMMEFIRYWKYDQGKISYRSSRPELFFGNFCLQLYWNHTSAWVLYSPVNLLHIFRTLFPKNTSERLLL